jgi:EmrB/QacA subfamily drug resistance transporter
VDDPIPLASARGRTLIAAASLGTGMAFLDSTVVNVALPTIGRDLDADLAALQWTVNGYTLTLAAFILLGGSLGDRMGRRRVFVVGAVWFAVASLVCATAPTIELLIAARAVQGVGGALMTPGSLAMIQSSIAEQDRGRAIGLWSGLTGVATVLGPFLGGWLVEWHWRSVFAINLPLALATIALTLRAAPESRDEQSGGRLDVPGAALAALALGGITYALIAGAETAYLAIGPGALGVVAAGAFVVRELRAPHPMVPPRLFRIRDFTVINIMTFAIYAALSGVLFLLVIQLQVSLGWRPLVAGIATVPSTILMLLLSPRSGALAQRIGPRVQLVAGPLVAAVGVALLAGVGPGDGYWADVLPGVVLLGAGLTALVAPLTATVLAAAPHHLTGTASGINNAVARTAGLLAVAALPAVGGLSGHAYDDPALLTPAYRAAMVTCAVLLAIGATIGLIGLRSPAARPTDAAAPAPARSTPPAPRSGRA